MESKKFDKPKEQPKTVRYIANKYLIHVHEEYLPPNLKRKTSHEENRQNVTPFIDWHEIDISDS